jgi:hypothetical protein
MNRADLIAFVLDGLDRQDLGTSKQPGLWVLQAEQRINKDMRAREQIRRQARPTFGTEIKLPADFIEMTSVRSMPDGKSIDYIPHWQYDDFVAASCQPTGAAQKYTIIGQELFLWPRQPALSQTVTNSIEISYYARLPPLLLDTDTNWLLETNFDVYYSAVMAFGYRYLQEMDAANNMDATATASIAVLNAAVDGSMTKGSRLVAKPAQTFGASGRRRRTY